jgi:hypothetical protein
MFLPTDMMRRIKAIHSAIWYDGLASSTSCSRHHRQDPAPIDPISLLALEGVFLFLNREAVTYVSREEDIDRLCRWSTISICEVGRGPHKAIFGSISWLAYG